MPTLKSDLLYLLRCLAVLVGTGILFGCAFSAVLIEINRSHNIMEGGLVEGVQVTVLLAAGIVYLVQAVHDRRPVGCVLAGLAVLSMALREMDGFFDRALWHGAWFYLVCIVWLGIAVYMARHFRAAVGQVRDFAGDSQGMMLFIGVIFAAVVAQIVGYKEIWNAMFDVDPYNAIDRAALTKEQDVARHIKNAVEESFELGSYLLILASTFLPKLLSRKSPEPRSPEG